MQWSKYMQTPRFLEMTRKFYLCSADLRPIIREHLFADEPITVLDVGCGSGFFTRLLAEGLTNGGKVYGLDQDEIYIQEAKKYAQTAGMAGKTEFLAGDACSLPFADDTFDVVTSYTFFNVVKEYPAAMGEMIRVTKSGGVIGSVDNMSLGHQTWHTGYYGDKDLFQRLGELEKKAWNMYQAICPIGGQVWGIPTSEVPSFFARSGLKRVRIYPLGRAFSLSNDAMPEGEKVEFIHLMYETSVEKLRIFQKHEQCGNYITLEECEEYRQLLEEKRDYLLAEVGENEIWEWHGGANLLTVGDVQKDVASEQSGKK